MARVAATMVGADHLVRHSGGMCLRASSRMDYPYQGMRSYHSGLSLNQTWPNVKRPAQSSLPLFIGLTTAHVGPKFKVG